MKKYKICIFILLNYSFLSFAQTEPPNDFFEGKKTTIKDPLKLRDPFKRKTKRIVSEEKKFGMLGESNTFSNLPSIENVPLEKIRIVGILLGRENRAIAKIQSEVEKTTDETYMLKEGMRLGVNDAEIKAILPGGVVVVEKIRNVYDQDEYLETIIPVTSE